MYVYIYVCILYNIKDLIFTNASDVQGVWNGTLKYPHYFPRIRKLKNGIKDFFQVTFVEIRMCWIFVQNPTFPIGPLSVPFQMLIPCIMFITIFIYKSWNALATAAVLRWVSNATNNTEFYLILKIKIVRSYERSAR